MKQNKTMKIKKKISYTFILLFLGSGITLNFLKIGMNNKLGFGTVGNWLIFCGFISLSLQIIKSLRKNKRIVDERIQYISWKASRLTFLCFIVISATIMFIDVLKPIQLPIYLLMSYMISGFVIIQLINQKIVEKYF